MTKRANIVLGRWNVYLASRIDLNMELTGLHNYSPRKISKIELKYAIRQLKPVGMAVAISCTTEAWATGRPRWRISVVWSWSERVKIVSWVPLILYLIWKGHRIVAAKGQDNVAPFFLGCFRCQNDPCSGLRGEFDLIFWYGWAATGISVGIKDCSSSLTWSIKSDWSADWICTCSFQSQAFLPPKPRRADLHGGSISDWEISSSLSGSSWGAGTKIILLVEIMVHNLVKWLTGRIGALSLRWSLRHSRGKYFNFECVF